MGDVVTWIYHYSYDPHSVGVFPVGAGVEEQKPVSTKLRIVVISNFRDGVSLALMEELDLYIWELLEYRIVLRGVKVVPA